MSDDVKETEPEDTGPVGGERLRAARRANDISIRDIAKELHLDEAKVRALEQNDFDVLGAPVFAKGYLRKYAEMVGVALDDVMTDYFKMTRSVSMPPIIGPVRKRHRDINVVPWILGFLVLAIVVAAAYWWLVLRTPGPASSGGTEPVPRPAVTRPLIPADEEEAAPAGTADSGEQPAATEAMSQSVQPEPAPATDEPAAEDSPAVTAQPQPQPAASEGQMTLRLTFSGDCWTEISDATGERLFYDLGAAGRVVTLAGAPPFRVILGDADNVSLTLDGQDYPIPESSRRGRLARLTIN